MNRFLTRHLFAPTDIASLVAFRVLFGAIMLWETWRFMDADRIYRYYVAPSFHFKYYGFTWVHPWPGNGMDWHFIGLGILSIFIMVGLWYRLSMVLFFFAFTYIFLLDQTQYLNHFYLVCIISFLLIFIPAHRSASIDAWWRPKIRSETVPAWALWLLLGQMGVVYFYAAIAKMNWDWLQGEPMRIWLAERENLTIVGRYFPVGRLFTEELVVYAFSYGGLLFDLLVAPCMLWRRTRPYAFACALFFHLTNSKLFGIGIFPWFSIAATLLFFPPSWPRRFFNWPRKQETPELTEPTAIPWRRLTLTLLAIFFAIQILVPFRHLLYPGVVHWTEEGHRFSWHMKLRTKRARAQFIVTDPKTRRTWRVKNGEYLTRRQIRKMSQRPDMILQFAHHLADKYREMGHPDVEVRAQVQSSLNGRKYQALIDPDANLAAEERNLRTASWIMPLTEPLVVP
ncbi:MAG: HTTM domain-containing protein [Phycisphaerales bacterium]|nr:HTTM domain-containing protein [Phycisphaerales bacterium]